LLPEAAHPPSPKQAGKMATPTQTLIVKLHYGTEIRRFTSKDPSTTLTWNALSERVQQSFELCLDRKKHFKVTYTDDEKDTITISTDDELHEAVALALTCEPSVLRLTISKTDKYAEKTDKKTATTDLKPEAVTNAETSLPAGPKPAAAAPPPLPVPPGMPAELAPFLETLAKQLPGMMASLPEHLKAMLPHAELDLAATLAANTPEARRADPFCPTEPHAAGAKAGVHEGVTCDKSGMCPIVGNRYHLVGHNYDLCEAEWMKLCDKEKTLFRKVPPPGAADTEPPAADKEPAAGPVGGAPVNNIHPGVQCDRSGVMPIVGMRYNLRGHNYDLCQAEFDKLPEGEKGLYTALPPPHFGGNGPWRAPPCGPWGWKRGGMGGHGMHGGMGRGGGDHCKLAARFVRDVTIFDGTQMAPGTQFTKIWRLKNVGEVPWPPGTRMLFVGGDQMTTDMSVPLSRSTAVLPGEEVDVAVEMTAPTEHGRYLGYWRLTGPHMRRKFGQKVWCHVQVVDPSASGVEAFEDLPSTLAEIERKKSDLVAADAAADEHEPVDDDLEEAKQMSLASEPVKESTVDVSEQVTEPATEAPAVPATVVGLAPPTASPTAAAEVAVEAAGLKDGVEPTSDPTTDASKDGMASKPSSEFEFVSADPPANVPANGKAKVEPAAAAAAAAAAPGPSSLGVHAELAAMGFVDGALVDAVVAKNGDDVEACARDLAAATEWVHLLDDLEEMGFANRELNASLMLKHAGNMKRTVRDLVEA